MILVMYLEQMAGRLQVCLYRLVAGTLRPKTATFVVACDRTVRGHTVPGGTRSYYVFLLIVHRACMHVFALW